MLWIKKGFFKEEQSPRGEMGVLECLILRNICELRDKLFKSLKEYEN